MSRAWLTTLKRSASRPKITPRDASLPMWSPKQRQMVDVYVSLVQRCYREHLARQAALQARLLRVDPELLLRLHAVWLRRETKAARLMQRRWRATAQTRGGRERLAARRVGHALRHRREEKASSVLRTDREREIAELRAVLRLQVAVRRELCNSNSNPNPNPNLNLSPSPNPNPKPNQGGSPCERPSAPRGEATPKPKPKPSLTLA